jgi:hypothetical protein
MRAITLPSPFIGSLIPDHPRLAESVADDAAVSARTDIGPRIA